MATNLRLKTTDFKKPGFGPQLFDALIPAGIPFETTLEPPFWAHVAHILAERILSRIRVTAEDGSYCGELLIRDAGHGWVKVSKVSYVACDAGIEPVIDAEDSDLLIKHRGFGNFGVWSNQRGDWLGESHKSREAAEGYVRSHKLAMKSRKAA